MTLQFDFDLAFLDPDDETVTGSELNNHRIVFDVVGEYLQLDSTMTVETAVHQTIEYFPKLVDEYYENPFVDVVLALAQQIPYDHPAHFKLVEYVCSFARSYDLENPSPHFSRVWQNLGEHITDDLLYPDALDEEGEDPMSFVNTTTFRAILQQKHTLRFDSTMAWELDFVLSGNHTSESIQVCCAWILAMTRWFVHSAERCFDLVLEAQSADDDDESQKQNSCLGWIRRRKSKDGGTRPCLTMAKWRSWQVEFASIAHDEKLIPSVAAAVQETLALMVDMEKRRGLLHCEKA